MSNGKVFDICLGKISISSSLKTLHILELPENDCEGKNTLSEKSTPNMLLIDFLENMRQIEDGKGYNQLTTGSKDRDVGFQTAIFDQQSQSDSNAFNFLSQKKVN